MPCTECEINLGLFGEEQDDYETNGKQEVGDLCYFHYEIFELEK